MTVKRRLTTMIKSSVRALALAIIPLLVVACAPNPNDGFEAFAESFREANQADTIDPMLALYALEGTTESTRNLLKTTLQFELGLPITSIQFELLSGAPEETIRYTHQGIEYGPTVTPGYRMHVRYRTEDNFESRFTIGQLDDGSWRIVSSRPIETPGAESE